MFIPMSGSLDEGWVDWGQDKQGRSVAVVGIVGRPHAATRWCGHQRWSPDSVCRHAPGGCMHRGWVHARLMEANRHVFAGVLQPHDVVFLYTVGEWKKRAGRRDRRLGKSGRRRGIFIHRRGSPLQLLIYAVASCCHCSACGCCCRRGGRGGKTGGER